jgi:outer membrane protein OmpA-like peptidoglycan-associated protein
MSRAALFGTVILGAAALGGCATKTFVREQVGVVDAKVQATDAKVAAAQGEIAAHDAEIARLDKTTREALERATAAGKLAEGKFLYSMVLSDDSIKFAASRAELTPEARVRLDELVAKLKAENHNVYLEVQGHTDATGSAAGNLKLGEERAEAVRRYLNLHGVALNRIAAISYGADVPVADNRTRAGRAQNRRVVVVVLS